MRLVAVWKRVDVLETEELPRLAVDFSQGGVTARVVLDLPAEWDGWTRPQRVTWARQQVVDHLIANQYKSGEVLIYPDLEQMESAKYNFESLPGWATWTAPEAETWIEDNVVDLASAKVALKAMAKAIIHLRDISIEQ